MENLLYFGNVLIGILFTLIGFKIYNPFKGKDQPEKEELWYRKFGTFFMITGPLLVIFGIILLFL